MVLKAEVLSPNSLNECSGDVTTIIDAPCALGCNADVELAYEWLVFSRPVRQREKRLRHEVIRHDALILDDEGVLTRFRHQRDPHRPSQAVGS